MIKQPLLLCCLIIATTASSSSSWYEQRRIQDMERRMDYDIRRYKVMLYSKTYCKYSKGVKQILAKYGIDDMKTVELDLEPYMEEMQDHLKYVSGSRTVPQLYIKGKFVGGHEETKEKDKSGELEKLLLRAHAIRQPRR
uniref:Glutaredoxin domain-containing protein n=1 Tax=Parascaris univalens TaxID=6257 RepID=A0A915BFT5_PARUN